MTIVHLGRQRAIKVQTNGNMEVFGERFRSAPHSDAVHRHHHHAKQKK